MKMIMVNLKDQLRTLFRVRKKRRTQAPGPKPSVGGAIVRGGLKMNITHQITREQWEWLILLGWRATDVRKDRRRYINLPDNALSTLIHANSQERDTLHDQLIDSARG
jgi:hypothetical protein